MCLTPPQVLYAKDSGRVFQTDLLLLYNERIMLERVE